MQEGTLDLDDAQACGSLMHPCAPKDFLGERQIGTLEVWPVECALG